MDLIQVDREGLIMLENNFLFSSDELKIREEAKELVRSVNPELIRKMDTGEIEYPFEFLREAARRNLLGLRFSREYGGRGLKWTHEVVALEEISVLGAGVGCCYAMPSIVGEALSKFGTKEQKEKYLKPLIRGEILSAECLTEPRGGSDFFGTTTTAVKRGSRYVLNGEKRFIAGGAHADIFLVYARTNLDPSVPGHQALSCFIVEKNMGVKIGEIYGLLGFRGMGTARIVFKDVEVPEENLIGEENGGRRIFNQMMIPERLTSAAGSLGIRACLELAMKYADKRKAFGTKIRNFQGVNFKVAESITKLDAARALVYNAAKAADLADKNPEEYYYEARRLVSEAKLFATEVAWEIVNNAMQILGGIGYTQVYPVERALRDTRLGIIWTGSNEIMKMIIQHEAYRILRKMEVLSKDRDIELDAVEAYKIAEKVYE